MALQKISKIVKLKPPPQTTPTLSKYTEKEMARECVDQYLLTASLRAHFKRIFECVVHRQGQGFWVQAEYGAGKTHFLAAIVVLLMWIEEKVWDCLRDDELKKEYADALSKTRMFPVAFSLRGMGQSEGQDSLMRVFEEQIRESLELHDPALAAQVKLTSAEIADAWYTNEASTALKAAVAVSFQEEHHCTPDDFRAQHGPKKFGQEIVRSGLAEGRLKGKYKERFAYIYDQITKLGNYDGIIFVVDEYRSWQDRHVAGTAAYAEDEEVLETLAFVLPTQHLNIITMIASQGDMPQKLSGGGQGDRFMPLYLLADKNKGDFGEIVTFRCRELASGAATDIKDYYDLCRNEYKFIRQSQISLNYFTAIFPFQPRTFDVMRRITQSADQHNLPTARSAIRMAWQTLSDGELLKGKRLVTLSDIIRSDELRKGLNHEQYRDDFQGLQGAIEQLPELDVAPEEREQARRVLETLFLWVLSLPDNLRDGLTGQEVAEAAWLMDEAVDPTTQAEHILGKLTQSGFPIRVEKKTRDGKESDVYSYETSVTQVNPVRHFIPLKKKAKEDIKTQDLKWVESLFWQLADLTAEAQEELGVNGGIFADFQPTDQRTTQDRQAGKPAQYQFPHTAAGSTKRVHKVQYGGEVIVSDRWRAEFGEEIKNPDQHFRIVYLTSEPDANDAAITADLKDSRIAVCRPEALSADTREALADLIAAETMKRNSTAPNQEGLRAYADTKRREALKALLKDQLDEFRRGKVLTQKSYGIPTTEIFKVSKDREADLAGRLLEKAYDTPLFSPKDLKKDFTDNDAKKVFGGVFHKDPAKAEKDAATNFGVGLELCVKSHPGEFRPDASQALTRLRETISGRTDVPLAELKSALCKTPFGLTDSMVVLYACALVKLGGHELVLNPSSPITLANHVAASLRDANRVSERLVHVLTTHTLALCDWNAKLDKALLGARLVVSVQKGWKEVLPYARVLDDTLKPAATPDEEPERNEQLLAILGKLKTDVPEVEKSLTQLAAKLDGAVPKLLAETCARLTALTTVASFQEFDAAVRESYPTAEDFGKAFDQYARGRQLRDRAFDLSQARDYVSGACDIAGPIDLERNSLRSFFAFEALLTNPGVIPARIEHFERWKTGYVHAYRKAHRAYHEKLRELDAALDALKPQARALVKMNGIVEIGPPLPSTASVAADLAAVEKRLYVCPDAEEPAVDGAEPTCPKCSWTPHVAESLRDSNPVSERRGHVGEPLRDSQQPELALKKLSALVATGMADRFQRFKDAAIAGILKKAADQGDRPELQQLLDIVQVANADVLAGVLTDDLVEFLRKLLYDENLVQEEIPLAPIVQAVGAIEEEHIDEAVERFAKLLAKAVKDAKAKHGKSKRVRVFLRLESMDGGTQ